MGRHHTARGYGGGYRARVGCGPRHPRQRSAAPDDGTACPSGRRRVDERPGRPCLAASHLASGGRAGDALRSGCGSRACAYRPGRPAGLPAPPRGRTGWERRDRWDCRNRRDCCDRRTHSAPRGSAASRERAPPHRDERHGTAGPGPPGARAPSGRVPNDPASDVRASNDRRRHRAAAGPRPAPAPLRPAGTRHPTAVRAAYRGARRGPVGDHETAAAHPRCAGPGTFDPRGTDPGTTEHAADTRPGPTGHLAVRQADVRAGRIVHGRALPR